MAWWITVDDLVLPKQLAGHAALELVNTRAGWGDRYRPEQEYLVSLDHLTVLARLNGLLDDDSAERLRRRAAHDRGEADRIVLRARRLRSALHDVLLGAGSRAASRQLAGAATDARARQRLVIDAGSAHWVFPGPPALSQPLDAFLVSAGDLLVEGPRVTACPGRGCGWLFVNRSGRRRWCQMAVCGNRAKQAAHVARVRT